MQNSYWLNKSAGIYNLKENVRLAIMWCLGESEPTVELC